MLIYRLYHKIILSWGFELSLTMSITTTQTTTKEIVNVVATVTPIRIEDAVPTTIPIRPTATPTPVTDFYTHETIKEEINNNMLAARKKYIGTITVRGEIDSVEEFWCESHSSACQSYRQRRNLLDSIAMLPGIKLKGYPYIYCLLDSNLLPGSVEQAMKLNSGDTVKVRGEVISVTEDKIDLFPCTPVN